MKHSIFLAMAALAILPATAQLRVINNGSVHVGNYSTGSFSHVNAPERAVIITPNVAISDTTATLGINGTGQNLSGGKLSFGQGNANIKLNGNTVELKPGFSIEKGSVLDVGNSDGYNK